MADHRNESFGARGKKSLEFGDAGVDHFNRLYAYPSRVRYAIDMPPHVREMSESQRGEVDRELGRRPADVAIVLDALTQQSGHQ